MNDNVTKAKKIYDYYCRNCSKYKPTRKRNCVIAKNIIVPMINTLKETPYTKWLFNHTDFKNVECKDCDYKDMEEK